ncbi:MAG: hypothetical protein HZB18_02210 [Chloroflexi bacterium]|nr:hypothetical protein [Chloroflexota bacterium]
MKPNPILFPALQKFILRFQMWMAAVLLRQDYVNAMEFNALDGEEFSDDYFFGFHDVYEQVH